MPIWKRRQRALSLALVVTLLAGLVLVVSNGSAVAEQDVLYNGNFEAGFSNIPGCGAVGRGWGCFTNGGSIAYGFSDDQWTPVVADGQHSQLIELNTQQYAASESDRYAGIFQTVNLVQGSTYQLQLRGLMREQKPNPQDEKWRYRVQWGYTTNASTDWTLVNNWVELPWDKIDERTAPTGMQSFISNFVAPSGRITLFLRVWKKWGTPYRVLDVNLDAISLSGLSSPAPQPVPQAAPEVLPVGGGVLAVPPAENSGAPVIPVPPVSGSSAPVIAVPPAGSSSAPVVTVPPAAPAQGVISVPPANNGGVQVLPDNNVAIPGGAQQAASCFGANYIRNGGFEQGFSGSVPVYWQAFNNGGKSNYGYYDEKWTSVIKSGSHGLLLEINTRDMGAADGNRYSGVYQVVSGLVSGQTYEFSAWGMMREEMAHKDEDPGRYRVQWGFAPAAYGGTAAAINNWTDLSWGDIYVRQSPGAMLPFSVRFQAPNSSIVVGIRALKKWGTANRELDVNLDELRLASCGSSAAPGVVTVPPAYGGVTVVPPAGGVAVVPGYVDPPAPPPAPVAVCQYYTIKRGDTLTKIAARFGKSQWSLMQANRISNPNRIYAGQRLCIK